MHYPNIICNKYDNSVNYIDLKYKSLNNEIIIENITCNILKVNKKFINLEIKLSFFNYIVNKNLIYKFNSEDYEFFKSKNLINVNIKVINLEKFKFKVVNINNIDNIELKEEDYIDPISGCFMDDPVMFKSNNKIINTPINRTTALKCKKCPFTNTPLNLVEIIDAKELKNKIILWKEKNINIYKKIIDEQNKSYYLENQIIYDNMRNIVKKITSQFLDPDLKCEKKERTFLIENSTNKKGLEKKEVKAIKKILRTDPIHLYNNKFLYYEVNNNEFKLITQCRCKLCLENRIAYRQLIKN